MTKPVSRAYQTASERFFGALTVFVQAYGEGAGAVMLNQLRSAIDTANDRARDPSMTRKTHTIDLKFDSDDEERHALVRKLCRKMARTLLTQATLLADGRPPQAAYHNEDFFEGGTKEDLSEDLDEPELEVPAVEVPAEPDEDVS